MAPLPKQAVLQLSDYPAPEEARHQYVRLDSGEHTEGFPAAYPAGMTPDQVCAYPEYDQLLEALGDLWRVDAREILLCNGSDNGLALIAETFIEPGLDTAIVSQPSFVVIPRSLNLAGAKLIAVPVRDDLQVDVEAIQGSLPQAKLCMLACPDNPIGSMMPPLVTERWCRNFPDTLFVVDEAYFEYSGVTVLRLTQQFPNLLITRTFSKAWGMAGLRLGAIIGNRQLIRYLKRVRLPFDVNSAAVAVALRMLDRRDEVLAAVKGTLARKRMLIDELKRLGMTVIDTPANFFLLDWSDRAAAFTSFCKREGVLVRNCSPAHIDPGNACLYGKVRVSTGSAAENEMFLAVVRAFVAQPVS